MHVVAVNLASIEQFPEKPNGDRPKIELVRDQVLEYVNGFVRAKGRPPERIVLAQSDFNHCRRRILSRMQKPRRDAAKAEWLERRKAGSTEKWRDAKPEPLTDLDLSWNGIGIHAVGYSRHRPVDKT